MANNNKTKRTKPRDTTRKFKKKISILVQERVEYVDYKDVNLLQRFVSDRSKIRARRVSGNDTQQQRDIAIAIKNAREMALLPYAKRVTTQRSSRPERGSRGAEVAAAVPVEEPAELEQPLVEEAEEE
jgi:small subunit ribosomal protein S18